MYSNQYESKSMVNQIQSESPQTWTRIDQNFIVGQYLNLDDPRLIQSINIKQIVQSFENFQEKHINNETEHSIMPKNQKSILHNFQKHLITFLKKFMHFHKNKLLNEPSGIIAHALWLNFLENGSFNKKVLKLVFGFAEMNNHCELQLQKLSEKFSSFNSIYAKYSYNQICQAQQLLRKMAVVEVKTISKRFLRSNSNVGRFEEFYLYLQGFFVQLENGPLSRRMSKSSKKRQLRQEQHPNIRI